MTAATLAERLAGVDDHGLIVRLDHARRELAFSEKAPIRLKAMAEIVAIKAELGRRGLSAEGTAEKNAPAPSDAYPAPQAKGPSCD